MLPHVSRSGVEAKNAFPESLPVRLKVASLGTTLENHCSTMMTLNLACTLQ